MRPVILSNNQYMKIHDVLREEYPLGVLLIRSRMRSALGFTVRQHTEWTDAARYQTRIHLDFYSERKRTMFLLKFSDIIAKEHA